MKLWLFSLISLLGSNINAQPVVTLQARNPQTYDRPGFVPEVTSLIASLWDDGIDGLLGAIYGDKSASSAFAAATSAAAAGDTNVAESYLAEATSIIGDVWSDATGGVNEAWTSFTSAYDNQHIATGTSTSEGLWATSTWSDTTVTGATELATPRNLSNLQAVPSTSTSDNDKSLSTSAANTSSANRLLIPAAAACLTVGLLTVYNQFS